MCIVQVKSTIKIKVKITVDLTFRWCIVHLSKRNGITKMANKTVVSCSVDVDLFKALEVMGVKSKKAYCEKLIEDGIVEAVQKASQKDKLINDFINFK